MNHDILIDRLSKRVSDVGAYTFIATFSLAVHTKKSEAF